MNGQPDYPLDETEQIDDLADASETDSPDPTEQTSSPESRLAEVQAKADENWNLYLRAVAEVENTRKRAVRDVEHARKYALEAFSKEMLAVRDSFEMAIDAADAADPSSLAEGNEASLRLLTVALERFGICEVDPLGEPFNPEFHEAISMQPSADAEPGSVLIVAQKGYTLNGRLLRPAKVVVAAAI
ncbi:MAG: nucleotide exchange factor GrpE [Proteobacteria bacterium]|nr:nucleotide exchange factor GrpE [Pseudomonadota bacterium]